MTKLAAVFLGVCLSGVGFAQTLSGAKAVDMKIASVEWNPTGDCLAYSRTEVSGAAIGLYQVGAAQGTVSLHLKKSDAWTLQWFGSQDAAIVTVRSSAGHGRRVAVFLLDARSPEAVNLFDKTEAPDVFLNAEAILSPLLEHAIFKIQDGDFAFHYVLPPGGTALVPSTDLDEAERQGLIGPKWASSGTAFYLDRKSADAAYATLPPNGGSFRDQILRGIMNSELEAASTLEAGRNDSQENGLQASLAKSMAQSIKDQLTPAAAAGEPSLELIPDNGVLRQVRSPGPWQELDTAGINVAAQPQEAKVTAGPLEGKSQSLWLISGDKSWSTLVAPLAQAFWLAPGGRAIAYSVDGVLFVRRIGR